ncbi:hypothetical protein [Telmatospirillum sp.]|uniref:hypothetical protein n=1 Tax=Telmatospirillum sp. TaxID=2079197 RepID=UPI0028529707|nr:hypothetical protein [Telmatospirillum sp.]
MRFFGLLMAAGLTLCLAVSPAHAKKHAEADASEKGGLFQAPTAIDKPSMVLDTAIPKVSNRKGDTLRENSPAPADVAAAPATTAPVKAAVPPRNIESMRLHSLFE